MRLVVFGASGGVGRRLIEQALADGHQVTAAVRSPAEVAPLRERLRVLRCDATNPADVHDAVAGHDAVLCALGADSWGQTALYSTAAGNVALAMQVQGVRRLVFLSNFGVQGEQARGASQAALLFIARRVLRHTLADHRLALEELSRSPLAWTAVRPLAMSNGPVTGRYRVAADGLLPPGGARVSRADVAHFMLGQAAGDEFLKSAPAIAY